MVIPAGRFDASAVTAAVRQSPVGPRRPRRLRFDFRQTFQRLRILFRRRRILSVNHERGRMPGAANNRDALEPFPHSGANCLSHPGLSMALTPGFAPGFLLSLWL